MSKKAGQLQADLAQLPQALLASGSGGPSLRGTPSIALMVLPPAGARSLHHSYAGPKHFFLPSMVRARAC
ncbi:hypothetical protein BN381_80418 [Candidatus Microthrix parvicella RN1]|uniref:Uncharacterized protein n=1 Tax=Candidatus Neomicrothrix parvicella RN1 TaxID=1229780 RepID=R4Z593_9ACTN|nr:hypothetical protein BN381_80418 [Candidatus Microthrix parvicella RN1]